MIRVMTETTTDLVARGWPQATTASSQIARELLTGPKGRGNMSMRDLWIAATMKDLVLVAPKSTMR